MRIAIAQIDPVVGAFGENLRKIAEAYERACQGQARFLLTPELSLCGYPPHDLLDRPEMLERNEAALEQARALTEGRDCVLVVGHVSRSPRETGRALQNTISLFSQGRELHRQSKTLLPTYDVFDEARYFEPAEACQAWLSPEGPIGFAICEDFWGEEVGAHSGRQWYRSNPIEQLRAQGPQLWVSLSASPYEWGKRERRERVHAEIAERSGSPLIYVNAVGATDEIVFDGASFACDANGAVIARLPSFETSLGWLEWDPISRGLKGVGEPGHADAQSVPTEIEALHRALVLGIRAYFKGSGASRAILGLSGGIDSAVVGALAVEALGASQVLGVAMPSQYSSSHSLADAEALARALKCRFQVRPIKFLFSQSQREIGEGKPGGLAPLAQENLQARLRGLILMTLANDEGALVLTTGNKSELAMGYCTLYGDLCGALAPLGDVFKTRVYELAREICRKNGPVIPESSITKAPSAELRPGQTDQDTLPPYPVLDGLLEDYLEKNQPPRALRQAWSSKWGGQEPDWVGEILARLERNEFKRRQAPPVLKVSPKAFGLGRRVPLSKSWEV